MTLAWPASASKVSFLAPAWLTGIGHQRVLVNGGCTAYHQTGESNRVLAIDLEQCWSCGRQFKISSAFLNQVMIAWARNRTDCPRS